MAPRTGCAIAVHLSAEAHVIRGTAANPLDELCRVNLKGNLNLAWEAAAVGAQLFLFVRSIGVNDVGAFQRPIIAYDFTAPHSRYVVFGYVAELGSEALSVETVAEAVIIRSPLDCGSGGSGRFGSFMRWFRRGVSLPLCCTHNLVSLTTLNGFIDFLLACLTRHKALNQTFLVSDDEDASIPELLCRMGQVMGCHSRLRPVLVGNSPAIGDKLDGAQHLWGSSQVDIDMTRHLLGWALPLSANENLKNAAARI